MVAAGLSGVDRPNCLVVGPDQSEPMEIEAPLPARTVDGPSTVWFWATDDTPDLGASWGARPEDRSFPAPGAAKFGLVTFPPGSHTGMHATASVDFEVVLQGRILLELPDGTARELGPGTPVVLAGVPHRWHNPFPEPCIYAAVILGAQRG